MGAADFASTAPPENYEQFSLNSMIVRVEGKEESKLASIKLSCVGGKNLKSQLYPQREMIQNLVIQALSDYSFEKLNTDRGRSLFQDSILNSLNQFVEGKDLVRVDVLEFKEI